jgi:glycosyltransferase involved in cell wall biosynthesis
MGWREAYFSRFHRGTRQASRVFVSTPNLCHCSPEFEYLPLSLDVAMESIPLKQHNNANHGESVIILHAPSGPAVYKYKGTSHVTQAVETLQSEGLKVELRLIQNMTRAEAIKQFAQGDIFVEQLHLGAYGNTAIEAMAYGLPVISSQHPAHTHLIPNCPVIHADPSTLTDRLRELVINAKLRAEIGQQSYEFVRDFHSNQKIASHLFKIYQQDLELQAKGSRNTLENRHPQYD